MISAVVLVKDEAENLESCLKSLSFADELIVIDDYSLDNTHQLANKYGAKVYKRPLQNNFADQRNFGLEKAKGEWVLFVDADERVSHSLQYEITTEINDSLNTNQGYFIKRDDTIFGRKLKHGETSTVSLLRLGRKNAGTWKRAVHEIWDIKGKKSTLLHHLDHYPHPTVKEFLYEINYYSTLRAHELHHKRKRSNFLTIIIYPLGKFFYNYFIRLGFLDGIPGLIVAILMSLHSFLVRGKLWLISQKKYI